MITELIASVKPVMVKGQELLLVVTKSAAQVWVPKAQFDTTANTISYTSHKAGDKFIGKDGVEQVYKTDGNRYEGSSSSKLESTKELFLFLHSKGITPNISL